MYQKISKHFQDMVSHLCVYFLGANKQFEAFTDLAVMAHTFVNVSVSLLFTGNPNSCPFQQLGFRVTAHSVRPENPFCKSIDTQQLKLRNNSSSIFCRRAIGSNINEDTDDMFDGLFKKHGKVVYRSDDQKPSGAEVDDDAESLSFAVTMAKVANEVKASDIKVLFVKPLVYWTRFFIIATAFSRPQIDAIRARMADLAEEKFGKVPNGDLKPNSWTLLDFGDVVVHIFLPPQREFYNLEEFYANATSIELPFEDEKPFR